MASKLKAKSAPEAPEASLPAPIRRAQLDVGRRIEIRRQLRLEQEIEIRRDKQIRDGVEVEVDVQVYSDIPVPVDVDVEIDVDANRIETERVIAIRRVTDRVAADQMVTDGYQTLNKDIPSKAAIIASGRARYEQDMQEVLAEDRFPGTELDVYRKVIIELNRSRT